MVPLELGQVKGIHSDAVHQLPVATEVEANDILAVMLL